MIFNANNRLQIRNSGIVVPQMPAIGEATISWYSDPACVGAWQAKGAASQAASYLDLSGTGNDLTATTAPTWNTDTGWTFDGTTQYLITPITPTNTYSVIVRIANGASVTAQFAIGEGESSNSKVYGITPNRLNLHGVYCNGSTFDTRTPYVNAGVVGIAYNKAYINGTKSGADLTVGEITSVPFFIGCLNRVGSTDYFWPGDVLAVAIYSSELDGATMAEYSTAIAAL